MAYATINKSTDHFNTVLYTGDGTSSRGITGVEFQPDWVWLKARSKANSHILIDAVRGQKRLRSDTTGAEADVSSEFISFDTDGFTVTENAANEMNNNSTTYAAWNWKANGAGSANNDGSITSTVSVNTTAGFSVGTYSANATAGATVGHGLGVAPDMLIVKVRNNSNNWGVYHKKVGATKALYLDSTSGETTDGWLNNTAPGNDVFTLSGGNYGNASGYNLVFYAFTEKTGYSKFGSYTGNGNVDGTFVYTGFTPAFVMTKRSDSTSDWLICDNKRPGYNVINKKLFPNQSQVEDSYDSFDFVSNGFKIRSSGSGHNASGGTFIYMAFGQSIVGSNNIPATAR